MYAQLKKIDCNEVTIYLYKNWFYSFYNLRFQIWFSRCSCLFKKKSNVQKFILLLVHALHQVSLGVAVKKMVESSSSWITLFFLYNNRRMNIPTACVRQLLATWTPKCAKYQWPLPILLCFFVSNSIKHIRHRIIQQSFVT